MNFSCKEAESLRLVLLQRKGLWQLSPCGKKRALPESSADINPPEARLQHGCGGYTRSQKETCLCSK